MQLIAALMFAESAPVVYLLFAAGGFRLSTVTVMESSQHQATIGKLAVGIKVGGS